jgi:hypothetical protein
MDHHDTRVNRTDAAPPIPRRGHRSRWWVPALCAAGVTLGAPRPAHAQAEITAAELIAVYEGIKKAWSVYQDFQSLINGSDLTVATLINNAKDEIVREIHGTVTTQLENEVESSVRNWYEVSQTLAQYPNGNNMIMIFRISDILDRTNDAWVGLKNTMRDSNDLDLVRRVTPTFNVVAALRVSILRDLGQLQPPMPVAQSAIDQVLMDTLAADYALAGASTVSYTGPPTSFDPRSHLHASNTVRDKKLRAKYHPSAQYTCGGDCEALLYTPQRTYSCPWLDHYATGTCTGDTCMFCGAICPGDPWQGQIGYDLFFPRPWCQTNSDAADEALLDADPVVQLAKNSMRSMANAGQPPNPISPRLYTVYDSTYFPGYPGYLYGNMGL